MTRCPTPQLLQRLLADQLPDAETGAAGTHVEACPRCQQVLETLTALETADRAARSPAGPEAPPPPYPGEPAPSLADQASRGALGEGDLRWLRQLLCPATPAHDTGPAPAAPTAANWPMVPGYEILGELGRGGMSIVYKARQLRLNRLVALKLVRAEAAPVRRPRFLVEGEVLARLQHPNVVQIHDVGFHRWQAYFALELVEGGSLADRIDGKPLPSRGAARLVACLAQAVQAAHAQGVVHRDLKPANVLLTADGVPKLTDFGLAKTPDVDLRMTRAGEVLGTPAYMAPEQALGQAAQVGPQTDVYALGAILYEALTGRPPFLAETYQEVLRQVSGSEPVPPRRLQPQVPRDLETICLRCIQKEPSRRYASAGDLADDLQRFLYNRAIVARPTGPVGRLARMCRRNPLPASLLATILLVFLPALAGVAWQWRVAETGRAAAVRERDVARWREYRATRAAASGAPHPNAAGISAAFSPDGERLASASGITWSAPGTPVQFGRGGPRSGADREVGVRSPQVLP